MEKCFILGEFFSRLSFCFLLFQELKPNPVLLGKTKSTAGWNWPWMLGNAQIKISAWSTS